jgi:hypothetical protein
MYRSNKNPFTMKTPRKDSFFFFFFFFKDRKEEGFGKIMGVFFRIIGPLAETILGPSVYFDVIFFTVS